MVRKKTEAWCGEFVREVHERGGMFCSKVEVREIKGNEVESMIDV